ncbi:MAG: hypothetical protein K0S74_198 [Chlamydiales bacterium]|nr:hypothetical protein [Chlamydiales bacterium]
MFLSKKFATILLGALLGKYWNGSLNEHFHTAILTYPWATKFIANLIGSYILGVILRLILYGIGIFTIIHLLIATGILSSLFPLLSFPSEIAEPLLAGNYTIALETSMKYLGTSVTMAFLGFRIPWKSIEE